MLFEDSSFDFVVDQISIDPTGLPDAKPTFYYVDASIGSGKSFALVQYLKKSPHPATIGTQTNDLSVQFEADMTGEWLAAKAIYRDKKTTTRELDSGTPESSLQRYKDGCKADFPFLITNYDVAATTKENTHNRDLFNDEIVPVYERHQIDSVEFSQRLVADYIEPVDNGNSEFVRIKRTKKLRNFVQNNFQDKLIGNPHQTIKDALKRADDADYDVYVNREHLADFKEENRGWISLHAIMKPSRFAHYRTVTMLGANFKDSLMYHLWKDLVNFKPHPDIVADYHDIRDKAHLVDLYAFIHNDISATQLNKIGRQNYYNECEQAVASLIGDDEHIYCMNNEAPGEKHKWNLPNGARLSPDPRGINAFADRHVAVHMAALNDHPDTFGFLYRMFGIEAVDVKRATTYERVYQFAGRISIRVKNATDRTVIFVSDLGMARFLQEKFGCAEPKLLNLDLMKYTQPSKPNGRPKTKQMTPNEKRTYDAARKAAWRAKQKELAAVAP